MGEHEVDKMTKKFPSYKPMFSLFKKKEPEPQMHEKLTVVAIPQGATSVKVTENNVIISEQEKEAEEVIPSA